MEDAEHEARLAQLTAEMAWLRRLARALLRTDERFFRSRTRSGLVADVAIEVSDPVAISSERGDLGAG